MCKKYSKGEIMATEWLKNKNVMVVGASDGIGKYLAFKLILQFNCKIIGISNNRAEMEMLNDRLEEYKDNFSYYIFDATNEKSWEEFSEGLKTNKAKIDVLINCVGELPEFKTFEDYTQKDITKTMNANFYSAIFSIRHILSFLKESEEPAIINVACLASSLSIGGTSIYSASKSALKSYTQILAQELDKKFYVGLVLMGITNTKFYKNQNKIITSKLLERAMTPRVASRIIIDNMCKKKKRIVVGFKSLAYDHISRMFPTLSIEWIKRWLKYKKINLIDKNDDSEREIKEENTKTNKTQQKKTGVKKTKNQ